MTGRPPATASVAPSPAPAETPSRNGSASGLLNTPWYAAPDSARVAPTTAPRTTRGARTCHRIACPVSDSPDGRPSTRSTISPAIAAGASRAAPTVNPTSRAPASTSSAAASQPGRSRDGRDHPSARRADGAGRDPRRRTVRAGLAGRARRTVRAGLAGRARRTVRTGQARRAGLAGRTGRSPSGALGRRARPGERHQRDGAGDAVDTRSETVRTKSTTRGPHRDAMSSSRSIDVAGRARPSAWTSRAASPAWPRPAGSTSCRRGRSGRGRPRATYSADSLG